eukprot:CAMPEP_0171169554 /NCGR_PEP_ID=MMETSP0790-20130122/8271_1 /TAXON_ID=2925 /ORGANISM="Alexandrium catenella, Strain OF101" /LENGTH=166 /DNA_ID=CAMNT_0011634399 /DNA_START=120 /DNA_END=617 /DNA_ORIENTATION=-
MPAAKAGGKLLGSARTVLSRRGHCGPSSIGHDAQEMHWQVLWTRPSAMQPSKISESVQLLLLPSAAMPSRMAATACRVAALSASSTDSPTSSSPATPGTFGSCSVKPCGGRRAREAAVALLEGEVGPAREERELRRPAPRPARRGAGPHGGPQAQRALCHCPPPTD